VPNIKHPQFEPEGSTNTTESLVIVQLLVPSVRVNGVKVGEEPAVTKAGSMKENEKLSMGPLTAL
jgi:hypothetical protein